MNYMYTYNVANMLPCSCKESLGRKFHCYHTSHLVIN